MSERTFILGLGNQKCGTTWLYRYLNQAPNFRSGIAKEYHIWDALDTPCTRGKRVRPRQALFDGKRQRLRFRMQKFPQYYFDYFSSLYENDQTFTADVTPSYSGLDRRRLTFIRDNFASKGIKVKPIILIREPLSRIKSAVRFNLDRGMYQEGIEEGTTDFFQALEQYYKTEHCLLRTSYHVGISNALEVFGDTDLYVGIYENMFEQEEVERLSAFLGIPPKTEFTKNYVNKTKGKVETNTELETRIRDAYDEVYSFCYEKFPETQRLWS